MKPKGLDRCSLKHTFGVSWAATPAKAGAKGRSFFLGLTLNIYNKPHRSALELVAHLEERGLIVGDREEACRFLGVIGFDRLRVYFLSRRHIGESGRPFIRGTTFEEIKKLYEFDEELRSILFRYVGKVEVIFKTAVSEVVSQSFGCHPYFLKIIYSNNSSKNEVIASISHLNSKKASKDRRGKHYFDRYDDPPFPPLWTMREFMTFGEMSWFYQKLGNSIKGDIAKYMGLPSHKVLEQWIGSIVDLRNACAHHDRVFNRVFQKIPMTLRAESIPSGTDKNRVYAIAEVINFLISHRCGGCDLLLEIQRLCAKYPEVKAGEIGM